MPSTQALEFIREASKRFPTLRTVVLYGSFPKDEQDDRSDVDMLLVFRERDAERKHRAELVRLGNRIISDLEERGEKTWDFQFLITSDVRELDRSLKNAIRESGIVLYGKPKIDETELSLYVLYRYSVKNMQPVEKVKFYRALKHSGLSKFKIGNALLVPAEKAKDAGSLLRKFGIGESELRIYLE